MSKKRIVYSQLDLKFWRESVPDIEAVRPPRCLGCGTASRCTGRPLVVVGHGLRTRQLRGPLQVGAEPEEIVIWQRRFRCRDCGAVMVVTPTHVLRYRLFSSVAIAWALALHGVEKLPASGVRAAINPWRVVGATAARGWQSLGNWANAVKTSALLPVGRALAGTVRQVATTASWMLSGRAPPAFRGESVAHQAVAGTLYSLMDIAP